jgi:hypothetical protein
MPGAFDAQLMFRTTGAFTASASYGPLTVEGMPLRGAAVRIVIPTDTKIGAADTCQANVYASADNSTYYMVARREGSEVIGDHGGVEWVVPFHTTLKYVKLELLVTRTTAFDSVVVAGLVLNSKPWTRA